MVTGADIATDALTYKGTKYTWAGYLPSTGWDCSGFVNFVLGHDFGFTLPGGFRWSGKVHGPPAALYKTWSKASTVSTASPGVLCCWLTHIAIAVSSSNCISALGTGLGTPVTPIHSTGPPGEHLSLRKMNIVALSTGSGAGSGALGGASSGCATAALLFPYYLGKGVLLRGRERQGPEPGD